jgi:2-C-methyl-D-erythritol 4-phosphate cytidylyltransferase
MTQNYIIFTAGGSGKRMQSEIPKQFIPVAEKPLLMWAVESFEAVIPDLNKLIVIPENHIALWKDLCRQFNFKTEHQVVSGGQTRFHSVKNAVEIIKGDGLTGVHDGVRPFPSEGTILKAYQAAEKYGAAVPCVDSTDSLRQVKAGESHIIDRSEIKRIQTPQVFHTKLLKKAYQQEYQDTFTDDASVVESLGTKIRLTEGNEENIKVTRKMDLRIAVMLAEFYK